jgi:hypothetical protein
MQTNNIQAGPHVPLPLFGSPVVSASLGARAVPSGYKPTNVVSNIPDGDESKLTVPRRFHVYGTWMRPRPISTLFLVLVNQNL